MQLSEELINNVLETINQNSNKYIDEFSRN